MSETMASSAQAVATSEKSRSLNPSHGGGSSSDASGAPAPTRATRPSPIGRVEDRRGRHARFLACTTWARERARAFGALKLPVNDQPNPAQGVKVEVSELQAAVDLDIVVDTQGRSWMSPYRCAATWSSVPSGMTGLGVVEEHPADDVWLGDDDVEQPRVEAATIDAADVAAGYAAKTWLAPPADWGVGTSVIGDGSKVSALDPESKCMSSRVGVSPSTPHVRKTWHPLASPVDVIIDDVETPYDLPPEGPSSLITAVIRSGVDLVPTPSGEHPVVPIVVPVVPVVETVVVIVESEPSASTGLADPVG
jgi:hypothetical protein